MKEKTNSFHFNIPCGILSILSLLLMLFFVFEAITGQSLYIKTEGDPATTVTDFFLAVKSGQISNANQLLAEDEQIIFDSSNASTQAAAYERLFLSNLSCNVSGETSQNGLTATVPVTVTYLDLTKLASKYQAQVQTKVDEKTADTSDKSSFNSDGTLKNSVLDSIYDDMITGYAATADYSDCVATKSFDLNLTCTDGTWLITPDSELLTCLTGSISDSPKKSKSSYDLTAVISELAKNDRVAILTAVGSADYTATETDAEAEEAAAEEDGSKYAITDTVPTPNPDNYVTLTNADAATVLDVIEQARDCGLLGKDEEMAFSKSGNYTGNRGIQYYFDDSILVIMWKEQHGDQYLTFSEIKISDPSQFRRKIADDTYGSASQYFCTQLTNQVNSVVSMNADFYAFRNLGITVYDGEVHRCEGSLDTLFIDRNGDFMYYRRGEDTSEEAVQKVVDDNGVLFSLSFGPILVTDSQIQDVSSYPIGQNNERYSRSCLCQMDTLHYMYANIGYLSADITGGTSADLAQYVVDKGAKEAYLLDGGQTAEIIFNNEIYNYLSYGNERTVSDIIYFATGVPND